MQNKYNNILQNKFINDHYKRHIKKLHSLRLTNLSNLKDTIKQIPKIKSVNNYQKLLIERQNYHLYTKIMKINQKQHRKCITQPTRKLYKTKNFNKKIIQEENISLYNRLKAQKSTLPIKKLQDNYNQHIKYRTLSLKFNIKPINDKKKTHYMGLHNSNSYRINKNFTIAMRNGDKYSPNNKYVLLSDRKTQIDGINCRLKCIRTNHYYLLIAQIGNKNQKNNIYQLSIPEMQGQQLFNNFEYDYNAIAQNLTIKNGKLSFVQQPKKHVRLKTVYD